MAIRKTTLVDKLRALDRVSGSALAEALALVVAAAPLARILPFRWLGALAQRPLARQVRDPVTAAAIIDRVAWAVDRAAKRSPLRALCLERGLAAQVMLRRRGIDSTLVYGVAPVIGGDVEAHVWVHVDGIEVTGAAEAARFAPLASFPPGRHHAPLPRPRLL